MQYKTMVLELIQARPEMHDRLRKERMLLATMERTARELKTRHEELKELLSQARPGSDPSQIASEALEIALKELENSLPSASPPDEKSDPISIEDAMAFLRHHTPPA